jgi:hypothetical protein
MRLNRRSWTEEENARLRAFAAQGASIVRAAAALNRKIANVRIHARKIGAPFPHTRIFRKKFPETPSSSWRC